MKKLDIFRNLFRKLIEKEINTVKFDKLFNDLFKRGGLLKEMTDEEFDVIQEVWGYVEFYNPDKEKRKKDSALKGEEEILDIVKKALDKLEGVKEDGKAEEIKKKR